MSFGVLSSDHHNLQVVAVVGDLDHTVCHRLVGHIDGGSTLKNLKLENQYYSTQVGIRMFYAPFDLAYWDRNSNSTAEIGALIVRFRNLVDLAQLQKKLHLYQCDVQALVLDDNYGEQVNCAVKWAASHDFEVVYLDPDQGIREEAASFNEKFGIARLAELLHTVDWPYKTNKMKNVTGKQGVDRILHSIDTLSTSSDDDVEPDDEDREEIWRSFTTASIPSRPEPACGSRTPISVEESVCLDVVLENVHKSTNCADNRKELKKNNDENVIGIHGVKCSPTVPQSTQEVDDMTVFDTLIQSVENGTADLTIGDISKVREQISKMPFDDKFRIDKAEAIVRGIAEAMGSGDLGQRTTESDSE